MDIIETIIVLTLYFFSSIFNLKTKDYYIKEIKKYKKEKLIDPNELLSIIKQQNNIIYYTNKSYDFYGSYHEKYIITLKIHKQIDYTFDVIYYLLQNADNKIQKDIMKRWNLERRALSSINISFTDLTTIQKWLTKTTGLGIKFVDKQEAIEKEDRAYEYHKAESYYKNALTDYNAGDYKSAEEFINLALEIVKLKKYFNLQEQIADKKFSIKTSVEDNFESTTLQNNSKDNKESHISSKSKKIKLESCNKKDLLTINGFDDEKADKLLQERNNGKYYYDIESFVAEFELMPHQMIEIQDRLIFPSKPKNKIGRKIDW